MSWVAAETPDHVWLALGLNLPPHRIRWDRLRAALAATTGLRLAATSDVHVNPAIGRGLRGRFWNGAALVETRLSPPELLRRLKHLEQRLGRRGSGNRPADIDLIAWRRPHGGWLRLRTPALRLPHPAAHRRRFVLEPLRELRPAGGYPREIERALAAMNRRHAG